MPWKNINNFLGLQTNQSSKRIGLGYLATSKNMDNSTLGFLTPDKGYSIHGNRLATSGKITSSHVYRLRDGSEVALRVHDDETNAKLEWYNSQANEWEFLQNFTTDKILKFAAFNLTGANQLYLSNGTDAFSEWNGATTYVTQDILAAAGTVQVADNTNFDATGKFVLDGSTVTYTGKSGTTAFTGCTGTPAVSKNEGVAQLVDITTHAALPKLKIMHVAMGRLWGVRGTDPSLLEVSAQGDAESWGAGAGSPSDEFARDFPEGEGEITAISSIDKYVLIFKKNIVMAIWLEVSSDATAKIDNVRIIREGDNEGAISDWVIKRLKTVYYIPPKGGIRGVRPEAEDTFVPDDLTDIISPTVKDGVFDFESKLSWWEKEKKIVMTYKKDSDSGVNDTQVVVDFVKQPNGTNTRNLGIKNWPWNSSYVLNNELYLGDSFSPNTYKAFDGFDLDEAPQESIATLGAYDFGLVVDEKEITYLSISGKIASGHRIRFQLDYDDSGSRVHLESVFDTNDPLDQKFIVEPQQNTIGAFEHGSNPIGGNLADISELNSFFFFFQLPSEHKFYNLQLTAWGDGLNGNGDIVGNRWLLDNIGYNIEDANLEIDSELKKNFNES